MSILPYDALDELFSVMDIEVLIPILLALLVFLIGVLLYSLACYLFQAIGLFTLSKRRGYRYPWLAFIPVANVYLLGAVADNISYCKGKKSYFRYFLVGLSAGSVLLGMLQSAVFQNLLYNLYALTGQAVPTASLFISLLFGLLSTLLGLTGSVITYIVLFRIYQDYHESRAILYLILTVLFGLHPFFLFALRNRPSASLAGIRPEI